MAPKGGNAKKEGGRAKKAENEAKKQSAAEAEKVCGSNVIILHASLSVQSRSARRLMIGKTKM
jgi:hypothetical protein